MWNFNAFCEAEKKGLEKLWTNSVPEELLVDFCLTVPLHDVIALKAKCILGACGAGLNTPLQGGINPVTS